MPLAKGLLHKTYLFVKLKIVNTLWKSQKKRFKYIGANSCVFELPYISGYEYISIRDGFYAGKDVRIEAWGHYGNQTFSPSIEIGDNVTFTDRVYLSCIDRIEIGNGVLLGRDVFISDNSHGDSSIVMLGIQPQLRPLTSKGPVVIQNNVWIGRQVTVLSGVTIGENSIIGANSVVNCDIPANSVAAGNPARIVNGFK